MCIPYSHTYLHANEDSIQNAYFFHQPSTKHSKSYYKTSQGNKPRQAKPSPDQTRPEQLTKCELAVHVLVGSEVGDLLLHGDEGGLDEVVRVLGVAHSWGGGEQTRTARKRATESQQKK
jgi:hypothetical protein